MNTLTLSRFVPITLSQTHKWMLLASVCIFALALLSIGYGPAGWDWRLAIAWLAPERFNQFDALQINVVMQIRLPRFVLAVLVGLVLAQTGRQPKRCAVTRWPTHLLLALVRVRLWLLWRL